MNLRQLEIANNSRYSEVFAMIFILKNKDTVITQINTVYAG